MDDDRYARSSRPESLIASQFRCCRSLNRPKRPIAMASLMRLCGTNVAPSLLTWPKMAGK
jgi:hypothetical protein